MRPNRPLWLDAHLPPSLAPWMSERFGCETFSFDRLGYRTQTDEHVFAAGKAADAIIITKDADFPRLVAARGAPPAIIWLTFGNTSAAALRAVLSVRLELALKYVEDGEPLVEISAP